MLPVCPSAFSKVCMSGFVCDRSAVILPHCTSFASTLSLLHPFTMRDTISRDILSWREANAHVPLFNFTIEPITRSIVHSWEDEWERRRRERENNQANKIWNIKKVSILKMKDHCSSDVNSSVDCLTLRQLTQRALLYCQLSGYLTFGEDA
jgi:hypothetical protein